MEQPEINYTEPQLTCAGICRIAKISDPSRVNKTEPVMKMRCNSEGEPESRTSYKKGICEWPKQKKISFLSICCPCCVFGAVINSFKGKSNGRMGTLGYAILVIGFCYNVLGYYQSKIHLDIRLQKLLHPEKEVKIHDLFLTKSLGWEILIKRFKRKCLLFS